MNIFLWTHQFPQKRLRLHFLLRGSISDPEAFGELSGAGEEGSVVQHVTVQPISLSSCWYFHLLLCLMLPGPATLFAFSKEIELFSDVVIERHLPGFVEWERALGVKLIAETFNRASCF